MIVDNLSNLKDYIQIHPSLKDVMDFILTHDMESMPDGKVEIPSIDGFVNIQTIHPKTPEQSVWESHEKMIDVQIPLTGDEQIGYIPVSALSPSPYDEEKDITFYQEQTGGMVHIRKGMFAVFYPQDAHAPGITPAIMRKAVFKIPVIKNT